MATTGSILGLPKKNPTPLVRLNPYVRVDDNTGTVLSHPHLEELIKETDMLLQSEIKSQDKDVLVIEGQDCPIEDSQENESDETPDYDDEVEIGAE